MITCRIERQTGGDAGAGKIDYLNVPVRLASGLLFQLRDGQAPIIRAQP